MVYLISVFYVFDVDIAMYGCYSLINYGIDCLIEVEVVVNFILTFYFFKYIQCSMHCMLKVTFISWFIG